MARKSEVGVESMVFGASYINFAHDEKLFTYVDHFDPPIMLLFFVLSGMNMDFSSFATIGLVGVVYFLIRLVGKYGGAYHGCLATKKEKKTRIYLGFALAPQAGVAIGLGFLGQRMLPSSIGDTFLSIILCSSVLYEMAGPILAKVALIKTGAIPAEAFKKKAKPQPTTRVIECLPLDFSEMNDSQQPNLEIGTRTARTFLRQPPSEPAGNLPRAAKPCLKNLNATAACLAKSYALSSAWKHALVS